VACPRPCPDEQDDDFALDVGDFTLTERSGKTVSRADLLGKVWVASFVFTRCTGPCPQVTGTMARLQSELHNQPDVVLVTFTVDPEHDKPGELKRYADNFRADQQRWLFLTGKEADIHRLLKEGFRVPVQRNEGPARIAGQEVEHSSRLAVVDRRGRVRGYYHGIAETDGPDPRGEFEGNLQLLRNKVAALLREQP
jgi:cytochrome oxidase Cu insertion factor (SCO1/SenC/PrrC family)